jgi:hypothetical protein
VLALVIITKTVNIERHSSGGFISPGALLIPSRDEDQKEFMKTKLPIELAIKGINAPF